MAADIEAEKEVWINSGSLFDAIRASVSLPLFFTPFDYNGIKLIDGGVLNPVPIAPTFNDDTDITIAVNLGGPIINNAEKKSKTSNIGEIEPLIRKSITSFIASFQKSTKKAVQKGWGMYDVADKAFDAMQSTIGRQKIAAYPPDVDVIIARNACSTLEFERSSEMIELGYNTAAKIFKNLN